MALGSCVFYFQKNFGGFYFDKKRSDNFILRLLHNTFANKVYGNSIYLNKNAEA
jgi:hypothetical protein